MSELSTDELFAENERLQARIAHLENALVVTQTETYLTALRDTTQTLMSQLDLDDLFQSIIQRAASMENAEHAYFYVLEKDNLTMRCSAALGVFEPYIGQVMSMKEGLTGKVWVDEEIVVLDSYDNWPHRHPDIPKGEFGSVVGLPLRSEGLIIGVIGLAFSDPQRRFSHADIEILQAFADLSAIVLHNARIHEALRTSERFVQKVADTLPDILYVQDLKVGRSIYANKPRRSVLGYDTDELQKLNRTSTPLLIHPDDIARVAAHGKNAPHWADDMIASLEYRMMHADGQWRWFRTRETIFQRDAEGKPTQLLGIAQDITETKNVEDALRESEERFRALIEMVDVIVFLYQKEGVTYINPAIERITGYTAAMLLGDKFWGIIHPDLLQVIMGQNQQFLKTGQIPPRQEIQVRTATNTVLWLDLSQTLVNLNGEEALLGTAIDITERKKAEVEALSFQLEKERVSLLAEFVQSMSHDFRTPLTTINTSLYLLERSQDEERRKTRIKIIQEQLGVLEKLITGMTTMFMLDSGILQFSHLNIHTMLYDMEKDLRRAAESKNHSFSLMVEDQLPEIKGNESKLQLAVENLVSNAIRYTPEGGSIVVQAGIDQEMIYIAVQDSGMGIFEDEVPRIFQRLYRADQARSVGGLGLGLPIALKVVEGHHGRIDVTTAPGEGSTFTIFLPINS